MPLDFPCPECGAPVGDRCYDGRTMSYPPEHRTRRAVSHEWRCTLADGMPEKLRAIARSLDARAAAADRRADVYLRYAETVRKLAAARDEESG